MPRLHGQTLGYDFIIDKALSILKYSYDSLGFSSDEYAADLASSQTSRGSRSRKRLGNILSGFSPFKQKKASRLNRKLKNLLRQLPLKLPGPIARLTGQAKLSWPGRVLNQLPWNKHLQRLRRDRRLLLFFTGILLVLIPVAFLILRNPKPTEAAWWNDAWIYRKQIDINYSGDTSLTYFQVELDEVDVDGLNSSGKLNSDCSDLRFIASNGEELNYWIEDESDSSDANSCSSSDYDIWVKVPSIQTGNTFIYMYYGNKSATSTRSNGGVTFEMFDDFDDSTLNDAIWDKTEDTISVTNGNLDLLATDDATDLAGISSTSTYGDTAPTDNDASVITFRAKQDNTAALARLGFSNTSDLLVSYNTDDSAAFLFDSTTGGNHETETANGGSTQTSTVAVSEDTSFHEYHIIWDSTDSVTFQVDSTTASHTTQVPNSAQYVRLETTDTSNTTSVDHVFVRKFAADEPVAPAYASYGSEEIGPGPVLYWKLDEGYGSTAFDSAQDHDGTISNASWRGEDLCLIGKCLNFDGSNDNISASDTNLLDFDSSGSFTVQAWVRKPSMTTGTEAIVSKYETAGGDGGFELYFDGTGNVYFGIDNDNSSFPADSAFDTSTDYSDSRWHMITGVKDGTSSIKLYIDGELKDTDASLTASGDISNGDSLYAGTRNGDSSYDFDGFIDEVKIYPYARTADEITTDYSAGQAGHASSRGAAAVFGAKDENFLYEGLVGYWPMDEGVTGDSQYINDYSGGRFDGTSDQGANGTGMDCSVAGKFGGACEFDGNDDYIFLDDRDILYGKSAGTFAAWIRPDFTETDDGIRYIWGDGPHSVRFNANRDDFNLQLQTSGGSEYVETEDITFQKNSWHHIAGVYDGENLKLYWDGQLEATKSGFSGTYNNGSHIRIGAVYGGSAGIYWLGSIDEARLYERALSADEIKALYEWTPGPLAHWKMDENSGSTTQDSSGNNYSGTLNHNTSWEQGRYGSAVRFDGSIDDISFNSNPDIANESFTLMAWVKRDDVSNDASIISSRFENWDDVAVGFHMYQFSSTNGGNTCLHVGDGSNRYDTCSADNTTETLNTWEHVAVVFDREEGTSGSTIYINGVDAEYASYEQGDPTLIGDISNSNKLCVGDVVNGAADCDNAIPHPFDGLIDDVKIYDYARTPQQIIEDMNAGHPTPGSPIGSALGHWKFDEGYGSTAYDSGTGGNNGSLGTGDSAPSWSFNGKYNKALDFDDNGEHVDMGDIIDLSSSDDLTLSGWFYRDTATSDDTIIAKRSGLSAGDTGFIVYVDDANDTLIFEISDGSQEYQLESSSTFTSAGWNHFVVVWDDDSVSNTEIYINGNDDNATHTGTIGDIDAVNAGNLRIGTETDSGNPFDGKIDEIKIYNLALTASQVKLDYNKSSAVTLGGVADHNEECCSIPTPTAHWTIDEGTGTSTIRDYSGNAKDLTMNNFESSDWKQDFIRSGDMVLDFDGSNEYLSLSDDDDLDFDESGYAISVWAKHDPITDGSADYLLSKVDGTDGGYKIYLDGSGDYCIASDDDSTWDPDDLTCSSTHNYDDGRWHHIVAGSWERLDVDEFHFLYVDGVLVGYDTSVSGDNLNNSASLYIGVDDDGTTGAWDGQIDDVRIYRNYDFRHIEASYLYNRLSPYAWFKLDECQGSTVYNSTIDPGTGGNRNITGTLNIGGGGSYTSAGSCNSGTGSEAWNAGSDGRYNGSLGFDGNDDYINLGDVDELDAVEYGEFTIEAWVNRSSYNTNDVIVAKGLNIAGGTGNEGYYFYINPADYTLLLITNGSLSQLASCQNTRIISSGWNHIVATSKNGYNSVIDIYINGKLCVSTSTGASGDPSNSEDLIIGAESDGGNPFHGQIDNVKFYHSHFNAEQVKRMYNEGAVRFE